MFEPSYITNTHYSTHHMITSNLTTNESYCSQHLESYHPLGTWYTNRHTNIDDINCSICIYSRDIVHIWAVSMTQECIPDRKPSWISVDSIRYGEPCFFLREENSLCTCERIHYYEMWTSRNRMINIVWVSNLSWWYWFFLS